MKRLLGAVVATLALASTLTAGPVHNAVKPMAYQDGLFIAGNNDYTMRVGVVNDRVSDRYFQDKTSKKHVHDSAVDFHGVSLTLGFFDRVDVWTNFGSGTFSYQDEDAAGTSVGTSSTEGDLMWGLGANVILWNMDFTTISVNGSYHKLKADLKEIKFSGATNAYASQSNVKAKYRDWNLGLTVSQQIENFVPYVGIKYSDATLKWDNRTITSPSAWTFNDLESRSHVGGVLGCSFMAGKKLSLSIEGRFFDERAVALSGELRF